MNLLTRSVILPALIWMAWPATASAQTLDCDKDRDACLRFAVAEVATFVEECGKILRDSKPELDAAFAQWSVLKLPIPGLAEAIKSDAPGRVALRKKVAPYLKSIGAYEQEIECQGRLAMMKNKQPTLRTDSLRLPRDPLEPYIK